MDYRSRQRYLSPRAGRFGSITPAPSWSRPVAVRCLSSTSPAWPAHAAIAVSKGLPFTIAGGAVDDIELVAPYAVPPKNLVVKYGGMITGLALSPDGRFLVAGGDKGISLFNTSDGSRVAQR